MEATQALEAAQAEAAAAVDLAEQYAAGTDIVRREEGTPEIVKARMTEMRNEAMKKQRAVAVASQRLKDEMELRMRRATEVMRPLQDMIEQLNTGLETVGLYLGRNEEIMLLRDGESASSQEVITLRQMLLFMDEECAIAAEEGGLSAMDVESFDAWLLESPAHLDQILPERKGIVALRPRRHTRERHGDPQYNEAEREANKRTYWLIRNGDRLYRTLTDLYVEERILPYSDEFERIFSRTSHGRRVALRPGSLEWERAQEAAEDTERQYMRVGLILEGLLHRTPIFHPLPSQGVSFLDPASVRDGRVRYITDAEALLTTGKESFEQWRRRLAGELRVGMRVILGPGLHHERMESRHGNKRLSPSGAALPAVEGIYTIEERNEGGEMVFRYRETEPRWVNDGSWGGGEYRLPKRRASCRIKPSDSYVLPFDLATVEEMEGFLRSRESRHSYVEMWPILKAAIVAKQREAQVEAPFRTMLTGVLARENGVTVAEAEADVDSLITWWKTKNKYHRPLLLEAARPEIVPEPEEATTRGGRRRRSQQALFEEQTRQAEVGVLEAEGQEEVERSARAVRMLVAEHKRRLKDKSRGANPEVLDALKRAHPSYLAIVRARSGPYIVLEAAEPTKDVYVHESEYTARGKLRERREWVLPGLTRPKSWTVLAEHERWEGWELHADEREHLRGPEAEAIVAQVVAEAQADDKALAVAWDGGKRVRVWRQGDDASFDEAHLLTRDSKAPQIKEKERSWQRKAKRGPVTLSKWGWESENGLRGTLPWEERVFKHLSGEGDQDERPLKHNVVWRHEARIEALRAKQEGFDAVSARRAIMWGLMRALLASVSAEWLRRAWAKEKARFDEEFGDDELWEAHRKSKERHISFNLHRDIQSPSYGRHDRLEDALKWLIESDEDPTGQTVGQMLAAATERFGAEALARSRRRDDDEETEPFAFHAPDELLDYVLADERNDTERETDEEG
jgi:hypothetical protein